MTASTVAAKPRLFVYGAGGHAKIVIETIKRQGQADVIALLDDDLSKKGRELLGLQVLGGSEMLSQLRAAGVEHCFVAIGDNQVRRQKTEQLLRMGFQTVNVIDPTAIVLSEACEEKIAAEEKSLMLTFFIVTLLMLVRLNPDAAIKPEPLSVNPFPSITMLLFSTTTDAYTLSVNA